MSRPGAPLGSVSVNTEAHVQLLGLGLDGSGVANGALLVFDKTRFLFNAGEGFQARISAAAPALRAYNLRATPRSASAWSTGCA
jgi:hypothetical protein